MAILELWWDFSLVCCLSMGCQLSAGVGTMTAHRSAALAFTPVHLSHCLTMLNSFDLQSFSAPSVLFGSFLEKESFSLFSCLVPIYSITNIKADRPHPRNYSTRRHIPRTDNDSSLLFAALGKAEPLISTATRQKFDFDL